MADAQLQDASIPLRNSLDPSDIVPIVRADGIGGMQKTTLNLLKSMVAQAAETQQSIITKIGFTPVSPTDLQNATGSKIDASQIANNVTTTTAGSVLDARQGKVLQDQISALSIGGQETGVTIKTKLGAATASVDGYLQATDFATFSGKQNSIGYTPENVTNKANSVIPENVSSTKYPTTQYIESRLAQLDTGGVSQQELDVVAEDVSNRMPVEQSQTKAAVSTATDLRLVVVWADESNGGKKTLYWHNTAALEKLSV